MKCNEFEFGPWTTSLDAGLRLQLSAFWKRRMQCLTRLPAQGVGPGRGALAGAAAAALLLMLTPLVELAPRRANAEGAGAKPPLGRELGAERQAADAETQAARDGEFVAKFSNGVEVELIGLSMNPSKDQPWWRPDGTPLAERPYASARAHMGSGTPREICWRWKNLPNDPDYTLSWHTVPAYECAGAMGPHDASGQPIKGLWAAAVGLPGSPKTCTLQFSTSVSATPWKTVFSVDGKHYASSTSRADGKSRAVIWSRAREEAGKPEITVSFQTPGESTRLVAVKDGQEHPASSIQGGGASGFMQQTFTFDNLKLDDIERFELQTQTREIETIEFVNVSLEPEKRTKVELRRVESTGKPR